MSKVEALEALQEGTAEALAEATEDGTGMVRAKAMVAIAADPRLHRDILGVSAARELGVEAEYTQLMEG